MSNQPSSKQRARAATTADRRKAASLLSRTELARAFAVNHYTILKWEKEGLPVAVRGKGGAGGESRYSLPAAVRWFIDRELVKHGIDGGAVSVTQERARKERAQADKTELQIAERRGQVVPRDQVVREGRGFVRGSRARLLAIPRQLVQRGVIAPAREGDVRDLVHEALAELAAWPVVAGTPEASA